MELARALTITRTEVVRSYREATRERYLAHADVLRGWYWSSGFSGRTCAMCLAMHGRVFRLQARMVSHPNCRCVAVPLTLDAPAPATGAEWFEQQEPGVQRSVLGPGKFAAFTQKKFKLEELVGVRRSKRWGASRFEKSLSAILSQE